MSEQLVIVVLVASLAAVVFIGYALRSRHRIPVEKTQPTEIAQYQQRVEQVEQRVGALDTRVRALEVGRRRK